jgi:signal transduction histidine kinase
MSVSMKSNEDLLARLEARFETGREKYREDLKELREEIKCGQAEMKSTVCAMRPELEETIQCDMRAVTQPIQSEFDHTTFFNEATETKPDPGMMQSICLQKCSDPKKLWTAEEIGRHQQEDNQPCNSGMAQ